MQLSLSRTCAVVLGAGFAAMIAASSVSAKDYSYRKSVKKDSEVRLIPHSSFRGNCETKKAVITILNQPKYGTAKIKSGPRKFRKGGKGRMARCDGKTGIAAAVFYKPNAGYTGSDRLRYEVTFASGKKNVIAFRFTVGKPKSKDDGKGWVQAK